MVTIYHAFEDGIIAHAMSGHFYEKTYLVIAVGL